MVDTGDRLPIGSVPGGTTLLCVGPPMAGKRRLALRLLADGATDDDTTVLVSTDSSSAGLRAEYESALDGASPQTGVVDCAGDTFDEPGDDDRTRSVGTPGDLGGVGTAVVDLLDSLGAGTDRGIDRIGVLSLTTLALTTDGNRTARFVHSLTELVDRREGLAVLTAHDQSVERARLDAVESLVDGVLRVREHEEGVAVRVEGLPDGPDGWHSIPLTVRPRSDLGVAQPPSPAPGTSEPSSGGRDRRFDSLAELIDQVDSDRPTLTVCNRESPDDRFESVRSFFAALDIEVRETTLGTTHPRDVALLHRGPAQIASSPLSQLASGVETAMAEDDPFTTRRGPDVLEALHERVFNARGVERQFLIDASTAIEMTAWQTGGGRLLAGFQELSRYWESERSRRVMHRIADAGVDVHIYGEPDVVPSVDRANVTIHPDSSEEIASSWFVTFDGDGRTDRMGSLVVRETDPDVYEGFWTYEPTISRELSQYLSETYGVQDESGQHATS